MDNIQSTKLTQELEPLQARIEQFNANLATLEQELSQVETDLESFAQDRQRYDALQDVWTALGKLEELDAKDLFWNQLPEVVNHDDLLDRLGRQFEQLQNNVKARLKKQQVLRAQIEQCNEELVYLDELVCEAYLREQKRRDEFVVERDVKFFPMRAAVMPWNKETESERYFRRSMLIALLLSFLFGGIVPLINIPLPDLATQVAEIPERFARLVKSVPVIPETPPTPEPPEEEQKKIDKEKPVEEESTPAELQNVEETASKKIQSTGVLAFKDTFKDLIVDAPIAKLGPGSRIKNIAPLASGNSSARRSLVAMQATGTSGGIDGSTVSRKIGYGGKGGSSKQIGGVAFSKVKSKVSNLDEQEGRSLSSGPKPARTDEEIQIVFDRYKATLYRIYNKELRKNPTLRGNILLRISIEPNGSVSACTVESTDLTSPELIKKIVTRVLKFNFGPKKDAPKITILYPIDFLPAR